jgi:hypothetical protein
MLSSDETKAGGKPNPRKGKQAQSNRKSEQRNRKSEQPQDTKPDHVPNEREETRVEEINAPVMVAHDSGTGPSPTEPSPVSSETAEVVPVNYRVIADAWGNYSRTSLEQTRSYFEKLASARSLGAAFEVQAEFAKQACETFVTESQKIGELQGEMAKQRLKRLEGFMAKMTHGALGARQR